MRTWKVSHIHDHQGPAGRVPNVGPHLPSLQQPINLVKLWRLVAASQASCGQDVGLEPGGGREFQGVGNSATARDCFS